MNLWQRLNAIFQRERNSGGREFAFDEQVLQSLQEVARRENRSEQEVAAGLLRRALAERQSMDAAWNIWATLTPREQDMAALICLNYTTRQIAVRLGISPNTVKTHVENMLEKFGLRSRRELREMLDGWDFSAWLGKDEAGSVH
jgi:DNA-binding CsgD family transcriptional regulator